MQVGSRVFVAEVGHGARAGRVKRVYVDKDPARGDRVVVAFDDDMPDRDCFAQSVFASRAAAEASLVDPGGNSRRRSGKAA